jgi:opacity protein-like surface antigen
MRISSRALAMLAAVAMIGSGAAQAQERNVGVTIAHPTAIGMIWHVSEGVALRPEFSFSVIDGESTSALGSASQTDGSGVGIGISVLFYTNRWDDVRGFISPRFSYAHATASASSGGFESKMTTKAYDWSASYGAEYRPVDRFSVFGEVGLGGTTSTARSDVSSGKSTSTRWGTRAGVGIAVYFW